MPDPDPIKDAQATARAAMDQANSGLNAGLADPAFLQAADEYLTATVRFVDHCLRVGIPPSALMGTVLSPAIDIIVERRAQR